MRVIVVGGGIAGLSAGHLLRQRARAQGRALDVTVLEAAPRAGGHVWTVREDGFLVEAGPNGYLDREPAARALVDSLGLGGKLVEARPAARRRFIVRGGRLRRVPDSPPALVSSDALSLRGKLRLLAEPWARAAPAGREETVFEFARRRIGREAAEYLVDPAVAGISAGESRAVSVRAMFPAMVDMEREHGSLIRAMLARRRSGPARLVSFAGGMGTVIDALAVRLGPALRTGAAVSRIAPGSPGWRVTLEGGDELGTDRVVLALPAWRAARLCDRLDLSLARALAAFSAAGLAVVALAYRATDVARGLEGYGYLVTRGEHLDSLGVVWESSLFDGRAPARHVLLRAMLGGARRPEVASLSEAELVARARHEVARVMGVGAAPVKSWAFRWPQAIAQYTPGHLERVSQARAAAARHPGLELCGTSYDGISFASAIASAEQLAERMLDGPPAGRAAPADRAAPAACVGPAAVSGATASPGGTAPSERTIAV